MNKTEDQKPALIHIENINEGAEQIFSNLAAVLKYLEDQGWRITRPSLYRHHKEGKLLPETSGTYKQRAVDKYAKAFLKVIATGKRLRETSDNLQRQKLEEELKNLRLKNERDKFNYEKDRGLYVPKDRMEIELACHMGVLVAGLKHWLRTNAADWIAAVNGDHKRVGEFITLMDNGLDTLLNHYASKQEYEVVFEAEDEARCKPDDVVTEAYTPQASGSET